MIQFHSVLCIDKMNGISMNQHSELVLYSVHEQCNVSFYACMDMTDQLLSAGVLVYLCLGVNFVKDSK